MRRKWAVKKWMAERINSWFWPDISWFFFLQERNYFLDYLFTVDQRHVLTDDLQDNTDWNIGLWMLFHRSTSRRRSSFACTFFFHIDSKNVVHFKTLMMLTTSHAPGYTLLISCKCLSILHVKGESYLWLAACVANVSSDQWCTDVLMLFKCIREPVKMFRCPGGGLT